MNRFYTSDTHINHARIIELCNRPFASVDEMNEAIIYNWNYVVGEDDVVYHLGDVALGPKVEWDNLLPRLNGYKILVVGNHEPIFKANKQKFIDKFTPKFDDWFDEVHDNIIGLELANGRVVNLSHFPYDGDSHGEDRYTSYRLNDEGVPLIHGHTHLDSTISRSSAGTVQIHVGQDAHLFQPVSEQQIIDYIRLAEDMSPDALRRNLPN